jgi:hypothetical protein
MRSLKRLVQLPRGERSLLLRAAFAILLIRITLPWLALERVQRIAMLVVLPSNKTYTIDLIVCAIRRAARLITGSSCLEQALAAQALLTRHGYKPRLTIGVAKDRAHFEAHAWVTCGDEVLIGGPGTGRYTALLNLGLNPKLGLF